MSQRKKELSKENIYLINKLFYDDKYSEYKVYIETKISIPVIGRYLCLTRLEWEQKKHILKKELEDAANNHKNIVSTGQ